MSPTQSLYNPPTMEELRNIPVMQQILLTATYFASGAKRKRISPIDLFWASLEYLDPGCKQLNLIPGYSYHQMRDIPRNLRVRRNCGASKSMSPDKHTWDALKKASLLSYVNDQDIDAQTIILALLTISDSRIRCALRQISLTRISAIDSWPGGKINEDSLTNFQFGQAIYRALVNSGISKQNLVKIALKASYDLDFGTGFLMYLYVGVRSGLKAQIKRKPDLFLATLLGRAFEHHLKNIFFELGIASDQDQFVQILRTRKTPPKHAIGLNALLELRWQRG